LLGKAYKKKAMFELDGQCKNLQVIPTIDEVQIAVKEFLRFTVTTDGGLIARCQAKGRLTNP